MNKTGIDYLDFSWNPLAMRCTKVSPGCDNCWHLRMANRLASNPAIPDEARAAYAGETGPVLIESRLEEPLRRKKPATIGVQFMGDLFHKDVPGDYIWRVIEVAYQARQHTFQILTKRPARMLDVLTRSAWWNNDTPKNIWLGVTVENQATADERRPYFEQVPAAVKFVSYEPALGPVDWTGWQFVNQIISGGETGPGARPSHPDWHRGARDFCQAAGVAYFFKSWGEWVQVGETCRGGAYSWPGDDFEIIQKYPHVWMNTDGEIGERAIGIKGFCRVGKKRAGHYLDSRAWREMPG